MIEYSVFIVLFIIYMFFVGFANVIQGIAKRNKVHVVIGIVMWMFATGFYLI